MAWFLNSIWNRQERTTSPMPGENSVKTRYGNEPGTWPCPALTRKVGQLPAQLVRPSNLAPSSKDVLTAKSVDCFARSAG